MQNIFEADKQVTKISSHFQLDFRVIGLYLYGKVWKLSVNTYATNISISFKYVNAQIDKQAVYEVEISTGLYKHNRCSKLSCKGAFIFAKHSPAKA